MDDNVIVPEVITNGVVEIKQDQTDKTKDAGTAIVKDKPLSIKHSLFCEYLIKHGLTPLDSYMKAYPTCKRDSAYGRAEALLKDNRIMAEITRLRNDNCRDKLKDIEMLHNKAIKRLDSIIETSDKDSVAMAGINAVINRTVPIINKSMHVGVKVNRTELDRRSNALSE